jgi:hypothetical protein
MPQWLSNSTAQRQPPLAERLQLIAADRPIYCFRTTSAEPVDWNVNSLSGSRCDGQRVWCDIPNFDVAQGDIRLLWDPARAAWAFDLARASARGILPGAGALYWRWLDSWMSACPPWQGPQWMCGQEAFVRLLALLFGFWSVADAPETTSSRWTQMARLAWATGYRIDHHINYARSQKNNHALSEACGLMLVGHLFPELREAEHWFERGRTIFASELSRQVYADGSYVQHSFNYHRVMLQTAVVAALLAKWHGQPLENSTMQHIAAAEEFLFQMLDPKTGQVPLYGNNDGAWVLPLDEGDFSDYRGAVQAAHFLTTGKRRLPPGPWDEDLLWLFGPSALESPQEPVHKPESTAFTDGGYYTLRAPNSWGMIRCHTYRDRPGQYDPLHFDLWYQGQNVLRDCGTYQYFPPEGRPTENYFQLAGSHNTIEIDGRSPVERVSRFLYFPWPKANVRSFSAGTGQYPYFEGERLDYDRRPWHVLHRRAIMSLDGDTWLIVDDLLGSGQHTATLRWHLADVPAILDEDAHTIRLKFTSGDWCLSAWCDWGQSWDRLEVIRGRSEPGAIQGFAAPYYGDKLPIPVLEAEISAKLPLRLITMATPGHTPQWQLQGTSANGEIYQLRAGRQAWRVEFGRLDRSSRRTVIHADRIDPNASVTGTGTTQLVAASAVSKSRR